MILYPLYAAMIKAYKVVRNSSFFEMAKTLRNGLSMIETNNINHNWLDFTI